MTAEPAGRWVEVEGGRLFAEEAGPPDGPAVVLVHSALVDRRQWDDQMASFPAAGYRTIRYDLRGFGRSPAPVAPYSQVDDLVAVLDAFGVDRAALVGNSRGGGISIDAALAHPDRLWALVPVAAGVSGWEDEPEDLVERWREQARLWDAGQHEAAQDLELEVWAPSGVLPRGDERIRELARDNLAALGLDESLARDLEPPAFGRLEDIAAPALVVKAERDVDVIQRIADMFATRIPGARLVTIPGTDHLVNLREPEAFDHAVLDFLAEVGPARRPPPRRPSRRPTWQPR